MSATSGNAPGGYSDPPGAPGLIALAAIMQQYPGLDDVLNSAYTEDFTWKKTDIAAGVAGAVTASRIVLNGDVRALGGWAFRETTNAAPATLRLHDGNNANGEVLVGITLATNESTRDFIPVCGIEVFTGRVFVEIVSGSVEGVIYWK